MVVDEQEDGLLIKLGKAARSSDNKFHARIAFLGIRFVDGKSNPLAQFVDQQTSCSSTTTLHYVPLLPYPVAVPTIGK